MFLLFFVFFILVKGEGDVKVIVDYDVGRTPISASSDFIFDASENHNHMWRGNQTSSFPIQIPQWSNTNSYFCSVGILFRASTFNKGRLVIENEPTCNSEARLAIWDVSKDSSAAVDIGDCITIPTMHDNFAIFGVSYYWPFSYTITIYGNFQQLIIATSPTLNPTSLFTFLSSSFNSSFNSKELKEKEEELKELEKWSGRPKTILDTIAFFPFVNTPGNEWNPSLVEVAEMVVGCNGLELPLRNTPAASAPISSPSSPVFTSVLLEMWLAAENGDNNDGLIVDASPTFSYIAQVEDSLVLSAGRELKNIKGIFSSPSSPTHIILWRRYNDLDVFMNGTLYSRIPRAFGNKMVPAPLPALISILGTKWEGTMYLLAAHTSLAKTNEEKENIAKKLYDAGPFVDQCIFN